MKKHLAIFSGQTGQLILEGKKTIEVRFSKSKTAPFEAVSAGDLVYIKAGKEIIGQFKVRKVIFYDGIDEVDIMEIKKRYGKEAFDETFWQKQVISRYCTLIFIGNVTQLITSPIRIPKSTKDWVVLDLLMK